jgi:t-SNARE complex subunit (syntaxin)
MEIIQNPNLIQDLMRKKLEGEAHIELVNKVNQLESRHKDILKLEKSIEQMYKMFKDLQILVKAQGEIIENVEKNISNAKEYTINAELEIIKADDYLKAARKKKIIILIVVLVIFIVIGGVTLKLIL